jgi:hypothetical protein
MNQIATLIKHSFSPKIFQMGKNKLFVIFLLAFMIVGCVFDGGSKKKIVGNYYLWQWEGGRSYYLVDKHTSPNGGGLIDGTVQIIAWSDNYIYVQKKPLFSGEKKGWVIIDVKKQKITETISEQVMKERLSANGDSKIQFYSAESAWRKL